MALTEHPPNNHGTHEAQESQEIKKIRRHVRGLAEDMKRKVEIHLAGESESEKNKPKKSLGLRLSALLLGVKLDDDVSRQVSTSQAPEESSKIDGDISVKVDLGYQGIKGPERALTEKGVVIRSTETDNKTGIVVENEYTICDLVISKVSRTGSIDTPRGEWTQGDPVQPGFGTTEDAYATWDIAREAQTALSSYNRPSTTSLV